MYTDFYHFSEKPFEDNPDPKFLYLTPNYQEGLLSILTWIKDGHGFAAITGEAGTGKTFFIYTLLSHLDEKIITVLVSNPIITFKELLRQILLELEQPIREETEASLFHQFTGYLDRIMAQGKTLLIVLDEAQDFNDQSLDGIERFFDLRSKPIRIVFVVQSPFDFELDSTGLKRLGQKIEIKHRMKPFSEDESRGYMDHRLRLVGSSSEIFSPKTISMICSYAQGIPSLINHVCDNAFRVGCTMNREKIDTDIIEKVIQNLEGSRITPKIRLSIPPIRQIWRSPIRLTPSSKKVSIAILLLACLGGFFLFYEYLGKGFIQKLTTKPFTPSVQGKIEDILIKNTVPPSYEPKPTRPESSSLHSGAVLLTPEKEKQPLSEVFVVKRGETLFSLARKYYHMANTALVALILDFNPQITDANLILIDQEIKIPKITKELLVMQSSDYAYKIHVGTFRKPDFIKFYRDEPALKGKAIEILPRKVSPRDTWYQGVVGPFDNKDECLKVIEQFKEKGLLPVFGGILKME